MRHYFRMKKNEWKVKTMFYGTVLTVMEQHRGMMELLLKLYTALKEVPEEELKRDFTEKLAELIHAENQNHDQ